MSDVKSLIRETLLGNKAAKGREPVDEHIVSTMQGLLRPANSQTEMSPRIEFNPHDPDRRLAQALLKDSNFVRALQSEDEEEAVNYFERLNPYHRDAKHVVELARTLRNAGWPKQRI